MGNCEGARAEVGKPRLTRATSGYDAIRSRVHDTNELAGELRMLRRAARNGTQRGQVLVGALVFIGLLALLGGATLTFISSSQLQGKKDQAETYRRSLTEGAAGFAFADLSRPGAALCTGGASPNGVIPGSATMGATPAGSLTSGGEQLQYTVNSCYPNGIAGGGAGSGNGCFLCILTSGATSFDDNQSTVTVQLAPSTPTGAVGAVINGNSTFGGGPGGQICVQRPADGATCPLDVGVVGTINGLPAPQPMGTGGSAGVHVGTLSDPLQNTFVAPDITLPDNGNVTSPGVISQGVYDNINITGGTLNLNPGTYVITQSMQISGGGSIQGVGVTVYLACHGAGGAIACPSAAPATAPSIETFCGASLPANPTQAYLAAFGSGSGSLTLTAPTSGRYDGLAVFADRHNTAGICIAGNGAAQITGAVYGRSAGINIQGNGLQGQLGSIVIGALGIHVSSAANGLKLTDTGSGLGVFACDLIDATVTGVGRWSDSQSYTGTGRVVFQTNCNGGSGVISLSYSG